MHHDGPEDTLPFDLPLDDAPGPAPVLPEADAARIVQAALDEALPQPRRRRGLWLAAAAVLLFVGAPAGAALWTYATQPAPTSAPPPPSPEPEVPAPVTEAEAPAPPLVAPRPAPAPEPEARRRPKRRRPRAPAVPAAPQPPPPPTAAALLDAASEARGARRYEAAAAIYERLFELYPRSNATYVARVSAGGLALDARERPREAAKQFRAALKQRPGGPLDADARWGLARAQRALGDRAAEGAALRGLVDAHPKAAYAAEARARLEALDAAR